MSSWYSLRILLVARPSSKQFLINMHEIEVIPSLCGAVVVAIAPHHIPAPPPCSSSMVNSVFPAPCQETHILGEIQLPCGVESNFAERAASIRHKKILHRILVHASVRKHDHGTGSLYPTYTCQFVSFIWSVCFLHNYVYASVRKHGDVF
jgi:hypothetical protein